MPDTTKQLEREYVIPLRRHWLRVPQYERTGKAVKAIKLFIAKHMKVPDRDTEKVKLDVYFNNEIWFKGRASPPAKIKVKAVKEGDIVKVSFPETPEHVKFLKAKHERLFRKLEKTGEKPPETKAEEQKQEVKEEKTEEQKIEEKEKEKAVAEQGMKQAEQQAKSKKHLTKIKQPKIHRMALKK